MSETYEELQHENRYLIRQMVALKARVAELVSMLTDLLEVTEPPEPNCSCHVRPPCSDCVEYSAIRESHAEARKLLEPKP